MKINETKVQAIAALKDCLRTVPFVRIKKVRKRSVRGEIRPDFQVDLELPDNTSQLLLVEVKASGQPRFVREAVNQLIRYLAQYPKSYGVLIAPYISSRGAEICKKEGIGFMDLAGNCFLSFQQVFIQKEGFPNRYSEKRGLRTLFTPKASRILRVLLMKPDKNWKTQSLASEAKVSLGQVANVKKRLKEREWIEENDRGFKLRQPQTLLIEWTENYTYRKNQVREFYSMNEPDFIESQIARICVSMGIQYAFTGFSGARRVAPAVRTQIVMAYVADVPQDLLKKIELKEVSSGANVMLLIPYDEGVFFDAQDFDTEKVVSPVQLYLDLKGYRGRGEEAAEAIMRQVLLNVW